MHRKSTLFSAVVDVWRFRVFTLILLAIPANILDNTLELLVYSSGSAYTSANPWELLNWRMPLIVALAVLLIFLYFVCRRWCAFSPPCAPVLPR